MPTRYEGAIDFPEPSADDPREKLDKSCHPKCSSAWETYLKCGERIEAKVRGHASDMRCTGHASAHA